MTKQQNGNPHHAEKDVPAIVANAARHARVVEKAGKRVVAEGKQRELAVDSWQETEATGQEAGDGKTKRPIDESLRGEEKEAGKVGR